MFRRKPNPTKESTSNKSLSQYGFLDVPNLTNFDDDDACKDEDDNDEDLEAELLALTSEDIPKPKKQPAPKSAANLNDLDSMIKESLRDIPSDEDVSSGEDDPSILAELQDLQVGSVRQTEDRAEISRNDSNPIKSLLLDRLKMYEVAEQNAKVVNDLPKTKRMTRGINTLKDLIKKVEQGHNISEDEIPCAVSVAVTKSIPAPTTQTDDDVSLPNIPMRPENQPSNPPPIPPQTSKHSSSSEDVSDQPSVKKKPISDESPSIRETTSELPPKNDIDTLIQRQEEYKKAAVNAKKGGDMQTALNYVRIAKQFDSIIGKVKEGAAIDLSTLPPPLTIASLDNGPNISIKPPSAPLQRQESIKLTSSSTIVNNVPVSQPVVSSPPSENVVKQPKTVLEALEQRLMKFQEREEAAKNENDSRKVRQNGRIIKQYQEAIKVHKAGKPVPFDELPTPPGFPPIPTESKPPAPTPAAPSVKAPEPPPRVHEQKLPLVEPLSTSRTADENRDKSISIEKQLEVLIERQKLFKLSAVKAMKNDDIELAKDYLRKAKGMDQWINASKSGLPVDLSLVPSALEDEKSVPEIIRLNDCIEGTDLDVFKKLIDDLKQQVKMCVKTGDHFKAMGYVANANRLYKLASKTEKDLKVVQLAEAKNLQVPKFHYETKRFTTVQCNTDLMDNEVEVTLVQGINYNVPNPADVDTFVKLYFPYPTETPQQFKSSTVHNTNNPTYDVSTKFSIQRDVRACQRIFKRQSLKCEIFSKGGFFRSNTLIGTVNVKLQPLEKHCVIHDAFDLMDGRKTVGGKLEVKVKVRDPILAKELVPIEEKWLIIDS